MDVVQRRAALCVLAIASVVGCGGKKKPASLVAMDDVAAWAKKNACAVGSASTNDVPSGAQFSCVKPLGECGCRAVIAARSKDGGKHADTVQVLIANCRREIGARAAEDIVVHLLGSLAGLDLDKPFHDDTGDAPETAATVTRHYEDTDQPERDTTITWSKDVFSDGKPQRTETYKIVFSVPRVPGDHKLTWSDRPIITTAPACTSHAPTDEDMARIPGGPPIEVQLRCPPARKDEQVTAFEFDKHLVTCEQYARCVDAHACPEEPDDCHLAAVVSQPSAVAYCRWRQARLPTVHEWQRAVRGSEAIPYPTGSDWDETLGCRVPTLKSAPGGAQRCENTNVDGVTYYVDDPDDEWTSDDDCVDPKHPDLRQPVALLRVNTFLGRVAPQPPTRQLQFRCARTHGDH